MAAVESPLPSKSAREKPYLLNVDQDASKRLNLQNEMILELFRGKFVPNEVVSYLREIQDSKGTVRIADLATGTGVWLYTIRSQLEESSLRPELYGYDIHDQQFPPKQMRDGVTFQVSDILDTECAETIGPKYDYIHMRLLTAVLKVEDWPVAIDNALRMLNPGGYLHCVEIPVGPSFNEENNGSKSATAVWKRVKAVLQQTNKDLYCGTSIYKIFQDRNLRDASHTVLDIRDYEMRVRELHNLNGYNTIEEFVRTGVSRGAPALKAFGYDSEDEALTELKEAEKDYMERGAFIVFELHSVLGRKP